ncbi:hypothetical protein BZG02_20015 [Labilibaculum filiforme]|uniref:HTH araC/xylS-type domain-containing protein n=1 Tax=Labilibaculum filiforme TaxID=1940526 RepID=A0A2N3HQG9_9BACT|nr:hypothetical protein BZG02_20015 [Labilibaculum filiforme]
MVCEYINEKNAFCSVNDLATLLNCSDRTIRRLFKNELGICPKTYLKIIRFNLLCKKLESFPDLDWFDIVCECGYYDQMHFIHEFKSIMNCTPQSFMKKCKGRFYFHRPFLIEYIGK